MNPAVNYTRFEAIFLAGVRKGGMPEEYLPKGIERKFTSAPADFLGGAVFFREALLGVGGLRASLTALPAWNRTALLAAI